MTELTQAQVDAALTLLAECRDEIYGIIDSEWGRNAADHNPVVKKIDEFLASVGRS